MSSGTSKQNSMAEVARKREQAWGMKAIRDWLFRGGLIQIEEPVWKGDICTFTCIRPASRVGGPGGMEVRVNLLCKQMIFTQAARETMYECCEWKKERGASRRAVLFVPMGFGRNASDILGLYDQCMEYRD
jgi:hypothetical protein